MRTLATSAILLGLSAGLGFLAPSASKAAACTPGDPGTVSGIFTYGFWVANSGDVTCQVGDKLYTYTSASFTGAYNEGDTIMMAENMGNPLKHTVNVTNSLGHYSAGTYTFNYNIAVTSGEQMVNWGSGATSSSGSAVFDVTTTATNGGSCTYSVNITPPANGCVNQPFSPFQTSADFTNTVVASGTGLTGPSQFTNSVTQTPGPLSILGAGAAFGFSRKLRRRINASA